MQNCIKLLRCVSLYDLCIPGGVIGNIYILAQYSPLGVFFFTSRTWSTQLTLTDTSPCAYFFELHIICYIYVIIKVLLVDTDNYDNAHRSERSGGLIMHIESSDHLTYRIKPDELYILAVEKAEAEAFSTAKNVELRGF